LGAVGVQVMQVICMADVLSRCGQPRREAGELEILDGSFWDMRRVAAAKDMTEVLLSGPE
jgi:hypothetical protein